ncbi:PD-(D/E)XK nuclease family protein [Patiriisocius sp. Uisw_017]|jgi:ATP-dependent helicase/nuclease subunit B|uniref:PD-(D/E)XK nuclease family protein n=1 Tax=Patiriisocius sp. Uisw_017 TaxID=3230968 RepID=UPI0039EA0F6E
MVAFLEDSLQYLNNKHEDLASLTIILPSKRAGGFLLNYIKGQTTKTNFAPRIISIETFIEAVAELQIIDSTELLFKSYESYLKLESIKEKESFDSYSSWATTLLGDFNEIDRYLLDAHSFFNYLEAVQDINHWYLQDERTELIQKYLNFWESLASFYHLLTTSLTNERLGYQGLVYRKAAENIETYCNKNNSPHIFLGFNALNNAEQQIFKAILKSPVNDVIWDTDSYFMEDKGHSASLFLRKYKSTWPHYENNAFNFMHSNFVKQKNLTFTAVPKNVGQAKHVGNLLSSYTKEQLDSTAVILADENLLIPLLHSLPDNVQEVNITMGVPLKSFPFSVYFELLLGTKNKNNDELYYYKDVINLLNHPFIQILISDSLEIIDKINTANSTHLSKEAILSLTVKESRPFLNIIFKKWDDGPDAIQNCINLLGFAILKTSKNTIEFNVLQKLHEGLTQIGELDQKFSYLKSLQSIENLFSQFLATSTLDFKGDAYQGLQIMGVLESRVLDFKNVILTSVNEGTLPSGKSNASFITYDLKTAYGLPKFTEKDAIYTYHFTHLLHRCETATFIYNTHSEGLNTGEKSRFLLQLETANLTTHKITHNLVAPKATIRIPELKKIEKTDDVLRRIKEIAKKGFSPSALTNYIRNPIDFYFNKILNINDVEEVEETIAANTMGTIVHNALEYLYKPLINTELTIVALKIVKSKVSKEIAKQFETVFKGGNYSTGKNLLIFEVAKKYVLNFIDHEIKNIEAGNKITVLRLEHDLIIPIQIPQLDFEVNIRGSVDRVDKYNNQLRIIDYKTGKVNQSEVEIIDWSVLRKDYKYSKAFQVLTYTTMYNANKASTDTEAGIISFKNLSGGFLKFGIKESVGSRKKNQKIDQEVLALFKEELIQLILEICDPLIPFIEKEIK